MRRQGHARGASDGRGRRAQARSAAADALPRAGAAKTRFMSPASRRQALLPPPRSARCTSAFADRRCQSSGTRWPLATPTTLSLWRISASSAGPSLTASSILRQHDAGAARGAVGDQHVLDRLALRRGVDDEQALHRCGATACRAARGCACRAAPCRRCRSAPSSWPTAGRAGPRARRGRARCAPARRGCGRRRAAARGRRRGRRRA